MQGELCLCSFPCIPPPGFLILGESQLLISTGELRQWPRGFLAHWAKRPCRSFVFFQNFDQLGPWKLGFLLSTSPSISKIDCAACFSHPLLSLNFQNMQTYSLHIANCSADCATMTIQYHDKGRRPQALYELYIYISLYYITFSVVKVAAWPRRLDGLPQVGVNLPSVLKVTTKGDGGWICGQQSSAST